MLLVAGLVLFVLPWTMSEHIRYISVNANHGSLLFGIYNIYIYMNACDFNKLECFSIFLAEVSIPHPVM